MSDGSLVPIGDIRYQLLPEIVRLLQEVGNTSNLRVSSNYRVLDQEYLKKVRALITSIFLYVSSAKITDDDSKRRLLDGLLLELLDYDDYIRWGRVDYRVLMSILSRISWILNSVTGTYDIKVNPYAGEFKSSKKKTKNYKIL